jgi:L-iditol 2-dehydrogenase
MKAMRLTGIQQMEMLETPDPQIVNDTDVLIRMKVVGICGSDVHYYTTGRIGDQVCRYPYTVGHESAGVVEAVGPAVTAVKPGDRIAVEPAVSCGQCDQCKSHRSHTCRNLKFLGCPGQIEGCLSEYIVMPQECCFKIPDDMTLDQAAISEPLSIGLYAVKQSIGIKDKTVAILGAGPIGLSVLLAAKYMEAGKIYITDKIYSRVDTARENGADWAGNPDSQDIVEAISEAEPLLLDCVFECCGEQEAIDQSVEILKPGGKLMLVGIPEVDRISFDISKIRRKELCIQNVRRQNECVQETLDMIHSGKVSVDFMVTNRFDFADSKKGFDMVDNYEDGVIKAMIDL